MTTIYVGGVGKANVKQLLDQRKDPSMKVVVSNDLEAGPAIKRAPDGDAFYIGTCHTGAGGSLGAMLAFLGRQRTHTFGRQSRPDPAEIQKLLDSGVRAFGLSIDQINTVVPPLMDAIEGHGKQGGAP